jgi:hypothetical protein
MGELQSLTQRRRDAEKALNELLWNTDAPARPSAFDIFYIPSAALRESFSYLDFAGSCSRPGWPSPSRGLW